MTENIKKLLELVSKDEELSRSFEEASKLEGDEAKKAITKLAGEHGITLTEEDLKEPSGEIDEDELIAVAGGKKCGCFMGGGGIADRQSESQCICVAIGTGKGKRYPNNEEYNRCNCALAGSGFEGYVES